MLRQPKWSLRITHIPSGLSVVRTSEHYRNQHLAREAAMRYLKSRLYAEGKGFDEHDTQDEVKFTYDLPDDDMWPRELKDYRRNI